MITIDTLITQIEKPLLRERIADELKRISENK